MRPQGKRPRGTRGSGSAVEQEPGKLGSPCAVPLAGEELTHHSGAAAGDGVTLADLGQPWLLPVRQHNTWNLRLDALRQKLMNLVSASPG